MTEWRVIACAPHLEISEYGDVRVAETGAIRRAFPQSRGYLRVYIGWDGKHWRRASVHRLVCEAWHGPPFEGAVAAHADDDQTNNHYTNLRWATPKENSEDWMRNRRRSRKNATRSRGGASC